MKHWPANMWLQTPLELCYDLVTKHSLKPEDIEEIILDPATVGRMMFRPDGYESMMLAQFSIPYAIAAMICNPSPSREWYAAENLTNPKVLELAGKVHGSDAKPNELLDSFAIFRAGSFPEKTLIIKTKDGKVDYSQDFFGKETNLTVSGQLNGETYAQAFRNIYTFGPTFRAENSNTTRHAAEFWMIEPEIAFADLEDNMILAEQMIKYIINYVMEHAQEELQFFNKFVDKGLLERLNHVVSSDFGRVTYTEAVKLLEEHNDEFEYKVSWGIDLQTEHERYLTEKIFKKPVFVTDYPKEIKAFYMKMNEDNKTVAAMDLLVPAIGEIIGGSQREDDLAKLEERITELGMKPEDYDFYLDLRKYGSTRHAGFGLGFERMVMYATGIANIRDVIPYPRTVGKCQY